MAIILGSRLSYNSQRSRFFLSLWFQLALNLKSFKYSIHIFLFTASSFTSPLLYNTPRIRSKNVLCTCSFHFFFIDRSETSDEQFTYLITPYSTINHSSPNTIRFQSGRGGGQQRRPGSLYLDGGERCALVFVGRPADDILSHFC